VTAQVSQGNLIAAGFGILLISLVGINIMAGERAPQLGWIGLSSLAFVAIYLLAVRVIYDYEKKGVCELGAEDAEELKYNHITVRTAFIAYGINAAVVFTAAVLLPAIGKGIARDMGLGQTFVGNIFIGVSTSLPELVVSFSAFRMGAVDLAAGNLFGSNMFNISIIALDDFLFLKGPFLANISSGHMVSALSGVAMTAVAVIGIAYRRERKRLLLSWDSIAISAIFILNLLFLYEVS
jgi:cation:H+ antiporter